MEMASIKRNEIVIDLTRKHRQSSTCRPTPAMAVGSTAAYRCTEYWPWSLATM